MYYVCVLLSEKDKSFYIGYSADLKRRFIEHNAGKSKSTKYKTPYKLFFYEAFTNRKDAKHKEEYLKSGRGFRSLNKMLANSLGGVA